MTPEKLQRPDDGLADVWERHAGWWQREFTGGADVEYVEQILPLAADHLAGADRVLDLGCGEGQIARLALAGGADRVVGLDQAAAQLAEAVRRGGGVAYARGAGGALPFASGAFEAVVVCLVLEHVVDLDATFDEIARVLARGVGWCCSSTTPCSRPPAAGGSTIGCSTRPSSTGASAPIWRRTCRWRRSRPACGCPSSTVRSTAT